MAKNRYYYYDEETFSFVELKPRRSQALKKAGVLFMAASALALVLSWVFDLTVGTPQELALKDENRVLQTQLEHVKERMRDLSQELEHLSESDQELYRTILQAEPISEDLRQAGVGGTNPYAEFDGYSESTSRLLTETARQLDQLESQVNMQNQSYRELASLAEKRSSWLSQLPAILPAEGKVVSGHGMRMHPILKFRRMHHGIDILVPTGTPVYATGDGVIAESGRNSGLGKYVKINHTATGFTSVYAHLSEISDEVKKGRSVSRGQEIGLSGNTGLSAAPHLHYEVRGKDGRSMNPVFFFHPSMTPEQYREKFAELDNAESSLD